MSDAQTVKWEFPAADDTDCEGEALGHLEAIAAALTRIADVLDAGTLGVKVEQ